MELGYCRMGRVDYDSAMVAEFRRSVEQDIVPAVAAMKEDIRRRMGFDRIMYYDDAVSVSGEMPRPVIDERRYSAGRRRCMTRWSRP